MDPVVLCQQGRRGAGQTREDEAASLVQLPHLAPDGIRGQVLERGPLGRQRRIGVGERPGVVQHPAGVDGRRGLLLVPGSLVAVPLEVVHGEVERPRREVARHVDHALVDAELPGEVGDVLGDVVRDGVTHQRAQQHHLHRA